MSKLIVNEIEKSGTDPIVIISPVQVESNVTIYSGAGNPEGVKTAVVGSVYLSTAGAIYIKTSGSGNTGWSVVTAT
jgi:hypothetical protein